MPLFGKKHDNVNAAGQQTGQYPGDNTGVGTGAGTNTGRHGGKSHHHDPHHPSPNAPGSDGRTGGHNAGVTTGADGRTTDNTGITPGAASQNPMAPQTNAHGKPVHPGSTGHSGATKRLVGKVEVAVGSAVGSQNLKARGLAKEHDSAALRSQAAELEEAERLEKEAHARRDRAVAHGAHPDLGKLGGQNAGAGATNTNALGGGGRK